MKAPADRRSQRERIMAWLNLLQTSRVLQASIEDRLGPQTGLSWPEYELLWRLSCAAARPPQMTEIAGQLLASPSGLTRLADRLVAKGLIARDVPPDNRRVVRIRLTAPGRTALAAADRVFHEAVDASFSALLTDAEVGALRPILRKLLEHNGAWAAERCNPAFTGSFDDTAPRPC